MKPTNQQLEDMGFSTYAETQKAKTLATIPEIDTKIYKKVTGKYSIDINPKVIADEIEKELKPRKVNFKDSTGLEDFINDQKADGFTFENGVLTKHTTANPYPFLTEIANLITLCKVMPIDPWKVAEICCQALENNIINIYTEKEVQE